MLVRWIPLLAAILGVSGGIGGAYVGGAVANEGQKQRFDAERVTHVQDLRRATYVKYVEELERDFYRGGYPDKARAAEAAVDLVSSPAIRDAAAQATAAAGKSDLARFKQARDRFLELAQRELAKE